MASKTDGEADESKWGTSMFVPKFPMTVERFCELQDQRVSDLRAKAQARISQEFDRLINNPTSPEKLKHQISAVKEVIVATDEELRAMDSALANSRLKVEDHARAYQEKVEEVLSEFAKKKVNLAFVSSSVAAELCEELERMKLQHNEAVRKVKERDKEMSRLGDEIEDLRRQLTKMQNEQVHNWEVARQPNEPWRAFG